MASFVHGLVMFEVIVATATVVGFLLGSIVGYYAGWAACAEDVPKREKDNKDMVVCRWAIEGDKEWTTTPCHRFF